MGGLVNGIKVTNPLSLESSVVAILGCILLWRKVPLRYSLALAQNVLDTLDPIHNWFIEFQKHESKNAIDFSSPHLQRFYSGIILIVMFFTVID